MLSWEKLYKQSSKAQLDKALEIERFVKQQDSWKNAGDVSPQVGKKVALQNLKHQLKYQKSREQIVDLLLSFQFIDELLIQHLSNSKSTKIQNNSEGLLQRDAKCYFQYLGEKPFDHLLSSPYISYVFSKLAKKDRLKQLLHSNKNKSKELLQKARENAITPSQYSKEVEKLHKQSMRELDTYRSQILDEQFVILRDSTRQIVTPTVNEEELSRLLMLQLNPYSVEQDTDVILSNGEFSEALDRKRFKEEEKLIKLRILLKSARKIKLSENQQKYLNQWTEKGENQTRELYHFTNRSINDLSNKDKKTLQGFSHSGDLVQKYSDLRLTDLILELGHFYSDSLVKQFEGRILLKKCEQKYLQKGKTNFGSSFSSALDINQSIVIGSHLLDLERAKFDQESKLNKQDINNIIQISQYLKVQTPEGRQKYSFIYNGIENDLEELNKLPNRNKAISEWYRIKEEEFDFSFKLADQGREKKQLEISQVWKELTGKSVEQSNSQDLSKLVHTICERLFVLRKNSPPYLSNLISAILTHSNLAFGDKCILLGSLELTKFPLTIDSDDIVKLAKAGSNEIVSLQEIKKQIQLAQSRFTKEQKAFLFV